MKSCTKTHACARRTRKRVGRILTMGETHGTSDKAGQASRLEPARRLPFHVKPIPPCETSHAEQPLCHADYAAKGELPRAKQPPARACGPNVRVLPCCVVRESPLPNTLWHCVSAASQFGFWPAHSRGFNMRPTRGSISAPAKYIPPQRGAREQFRAFGNCCRKTLEYHPLMSLIVPVIIPR